MIRALRGTQNSSRNPLSGTTAVVEDKARTQDKDIVLLSYQPRDSMYNAVLKACRVKWGTSSTLEHLRGNSKAKQWCQVKFQQKKRRTVRAWCVPLPHRHCVFKKNWMGESLSRKRSNVAWYCKLYWVCSATLMCNTWQSCLVLNFPPLVRERTLANSLLHVNCDGTGTGAGSGRKGP